MLRIVLKHATRNVFFTIRKPRPQLNVQNSFQRKNKATNAQTLKCVWFFLRLKCNTKLLPMMLLVAVWIEYAPGTRQFPSVSRCWISRLHDFQSKKFAAALKWKLMLKHNITAPVDLLPIQNHSNWMQECVHQQKGPVTLILKGPAIPFGFHLCHGQKSRFFGDGHPTFNRNPFNGYINPYYWVDFSHPRLYGNNGSWSTRSHISCIAMLHLRSTCLEIIGSKIRTTKFPIFDEQSCHPINIGNIGVFNF